MSGGEFKAYAGRRVLVTGHTGFKGSWLALWLHRLGARVTGLSLPPGPQPNLFRAARVEEKLKHVEADVRDREALARLFREAEPEFVFHLAAQSLVRESYRDPERTFETNVMGVVNVLEQVRRFPAPRAVVIVTSDKCYENREWLYGYREADRLGGHDPYSASKAAAELLVECYRRSFFRPEAILSHGVALASARAGNVIGGGDWAPDRIVPDSVRALQSGGTVRVRHPSAVRPWQHVLEPVSGYLTLGARLTEDGRARFCEAWNFGPEAASRRSVRDLVETIIARWGGGRWEEASDAGPHEASRLSLSIEKARLSLGWSPRWDFERSVRETVDWYKAFYDGRDMSGFCEKQIAAYAEGG